MANHGELSMFGTLWSVDLVYGSGAFAAGVVSLQDGHILGGDACYHYVGACHVVGARLTGKVTVTHYAGPKNYAASKLDGFTLHIDGAPRSGVVELSGEVLEEPGRILTLRLTRLVSLPSAASP